MRIWEFEDSKDKVIPSDLVREQDFILRIRRLHRLGMPHLVINLVLGTLPALTANPLTLEAIQKQLQEFAKVTSGTYAEMSNGDAFIIWEETGDAHLLASRLLAVLMPDDNTDKDTSELLITYHLPQDYPPLRERANYYVEVVRMAAAKSVEAPVVQALQSEAARGPLTAWSVDQIERLLRDVDLRIYGRTQPICVYEASGKWRPVAEEFYISFDDLRRECFPKMDLIAPEHLFFVLCETLDHGLLATLAQHTDMLAGKSMHLNLAVVSMLSTAFVSFARMLTPEQRSRVTFELHRGDLLQDFPRTLNAIHTLKEEGFRVALDNITPDMVNYVDLQAFETDDIKIKVSKDCADQLRNPAILKGLKRLPVDRLIFAHCDSDNALSAGLELGVSRFQGWLIDETLAQQK